MILFMIISASRRTDIPAFYTRWLMNRIRQGECQVVNPYRRDQIKRVSLALGDVDVIVFWTRHALPLMPHLDELDQRGYRYFFQYTITNYPPALEHKTPSLAVAVQTFQALARKIGKERVIWRYDPVYLSPATSPDFHRRNFQTLAEALCGYSERCVISLFDDYAKTRKRLAQNPTLVPWIDDAQNFGAVLDGLMPDLVEIAGDNHYELLSCAEELDLRPYGIEPGKCVDDDLVRRVFGLEMAYRKDPGQRPACGCMSSQDIGRYDSCPFGCQYCYANRSFEQARQYYANHDSDRLYL